MRTPARAALAALAAVAALSIAAATMSSAATPSGEQGTRHRRPEWAPRAPSSTPTATTSLGAGGTGDGGVVNGGPPVIVPPVAGRARQEVRCDQRERRSGRHGVLRAVSAAEHDPLEPRPRSSSLGQA
jgi:hypothetical protein